MTIQITMAAVRRFMDLSKALIRKPSAIRLILREKNKSTIVAMDCNKNCSPDFFEPAKRPVL